MARRAGSRDQPTTGRIELPHDWSPRPWQQPLWNFIIGGGLRAVALWHRRAGKDSVGINAMVTRSHMEDPGLYYYMAPTQKHARKIIWDNIGSNGMRIMDQALPKVLRETTNDQEMRIVTKQGSIYQVLGSDNYDSIVGSNPKGMVFSEWSIAEKPEAWNYFRPILEENGGWALFIYTPRGFNHGYKTYQYALAQPDWFCEKLTIEDTGVLSPEQAKRIADEDITGMQGGSVEQEFYCLPPGTGIHASTGIVPIEKLAVGDLVLGHSGRFRRIEAVNERHIDDEMCVIETFGCGTPLLITPNHHVRVYDPEAHTHAWKAAGDIAVDDWMVMPKRKIAKTPMIGKEMAELIGAFICDGSCAKTAFNITIGSHRKDHIKRLAGILDAMSVSWSMFDCETATMIVGKDAELAERLRCMCGELAHNKRIPWAVIAGHEQTLYDMLMAGDGHISKDGSLHSYSTVSKSLAHDVAILTATIGRRPGITSAMRKDSFIRGRVIGARHRSYTVQSRDATAHTKTKMTKHTVPMRVKNVSRIGYSGLVYNIQVHVDKSYVAEGRVVHNCAFEAETARQLFSGTSLQRAYDAPPPEFDKGAPTIMGVDVARFGADKTVFAFRKNKDMRSIPWQRHQGLDTMQAGMRVMQAIDKYKVDACFIDETGMPGVCDYVKHHRPKDCYVQGIHFNSPSPDPDYGNIRAYMYATWAEWCRDPETCLPQSALLFEDLAALEKEFHKQSGAMLVTDKEKMRKKMGRSPDDSDAGALTFARPVPRRSMRHEMAIPRYAIMD